MLSSPLASPFIKLLPDVISKVSLVKLFHVRGILVRVVVGVPIKLVVPVEILIGIVCRVVVLG